MAELIARKLETVLEWIVILLMVLLTVVIIVAVLFRRKQDYAQPLARL